MSPLSSNYWAILEIEPGSDDASIKRAFRKQARLWHPDLNNNDPQAEEHFKQINEAYAILSDHKRRFEWEQSYSDDILQAKNINFFYSGFPSFESYSRLILKYSNEEREYSSQSNGFKSNEDYSYETIHSEESLIITNEELVIDLTPHQAIYGSWIEISLSDGTIIDVETPPLAGNGWFLRLPNVQDEGIDKFLQLRVKTKEGLSINGLTILYQLELLPTDAALGCTVSIPTLSGYATLQVPSCSSSGDLLILKGEGFRKGDQQGDQLIEIQIIMPIRLHQIEKMLYRRLSFM